MSRVMTGKPIHGGIYIGKIYFHGKSDCVRRLTGADPEKELLRFEAARERASSQLGELWERLKAEGQTEQAGIFEGQRMILADEEYGASVRQLLREETVNAEYAVDVVSRRFAEIFEGLEDAFFRARAVDIRDVGLRLRRIMETGNDDNGTGLGAEDMAVPPYPCMVMAEELTPSETVQMNRQLMRGLATRLGTGNSHTAILARTFGIPAVAGIEVSPDMDGAEAVLDGYQGILILEPDEAQLEHYRTRLLAEQKERNDLLKYRSRETRTPAGKKVPVYANIGDPSDLAAVMENDAEGIGLFRSEFCYLKEKELPTEEMLFQVYQKIVSKMRGKRVVIRTMDIGSDKQAGYLGLKKEENPALGYRAIRICLTREDVFRTQLRAVLRAAAFGNVAVMYPMITSLWEVRQIRELLEDVQRELDEEGIAYGRLQQGIVVETPAAALISDLLAAEVDFFSIGTNDLAQYTLAVDRQNPALEPFYDDRHEAVLRLVRMTVENGHRAGIPVGICGELAADTSLTDTLMELGIDELSVSPAKVLSVRRAVMEGKCGK